MSTPTGNIVIRPIESRDASQATKLWCDGLQQTVDTAPDDEKRQAYAEFFAKCVREECSPGGAMGVDGEGLIEYYCRSSTSEDDEQQGTDATMFVAVQQGDEGEEEGVIGMVGVKRGMDSKTFPADRSTEDYGTFSIWKMSVGKASRGTGVGKRLMVAAEGWVRRQPDAKTMRLYTANPIAANFYTSKDVGFTVLKQTDHYGIYEKKL